MTISGGIVKGIGAPGRTHSYGIRGGTIQIEAATVTGTGEDSGNTSLGIFSSNALSISGGDVTGIGSTGQLSSGIATNSKLEIKNATVKAEGGAASTQFSCGLYAAQTCSIGDSTVTATGGSADTGGSYGILSDSDASTVTINGNSVVRADMTGTEDVDGKPISGDTINRNSGVIFENGVGTVYGSVELQEDLTIGANESLDIPNGASLTIPAGTTLTVEQGGTLTGNVSGKVVYAVTVLTSGSGSASASPTVAKAGDIVALTASPSSGYHFERWEVVFGGVTLTGNQFTMLDQPVTVKAVFEKNPYIPPTYAVTVPDTTGGTVEVSPSRASSGRRVTITTQPAPGYELESLTVLDSRGSEIALTDQGDGKYTFTMPSRKVTVQASFAPVPLPFEDVPPGAWYESAVRYAYTHGIMEGMSETAFSPNTSLTRAEAVQVLYNLEGQPEGSGTAAFPDLVYEWYKPAIAWAEQTGVVDGYEDGAFRPDEPVTREEFAQMLYNYAAYKGYDLTAEGDLTAFPDGSEVQEWAVPAMAWANGNELINGHDDGTLEPGGTTTRAQAASILMRFDQKLVEE